MLESGDKRNFLRNRLAFNGQGGFKDTLSALASPITSLGAASRDFGSHLRDLVKYPEARDDFVGKWAGSAKGDQLRQMVKDNSFFTPDVANSELADANFRAIDRPNAEYGGYFQQEQMPNGGKNNPSFLDKAFGQNPGSIYINNISGPAAASNAGHELLHKVWDQRIQNQPVGALFQNRFIKTVANDPDSIDYLREQGLLKNPNNPSSGSLYGFPETIYDAPPTEVFAYIGQAFQAHPWDMPIALRPYYKGVLDFSVSPERQKASVRQSVHNNLFGAMDAFRRGEQDAVLNPPQTAEEKQWNAEDKASAQAMIDGLSRKNYQNVMSAHDTLSAAPKRNFLQKAVSAATDPLDRVSATITSFFRNAF